MILWIMRPCEEAGRLCMRAMLGGAGEGNQKHLYQFGINLGIAFQVQDDYLDAFGDPVKFGKQLGGDILSNKKTFLLIHALEVCSSLQLAKLASLPESDDDKIATVLEIYKDCHVDDWAMQLKEKYFSQAMNHLEETAVVSSRKKPLTELA